MKAMLPDIEEVLLKPGASVRFEDRDDLLAKLDRLGRPIPGRVHGRTRDHREHYVMLRYLRLWRAGRRAPPATRHPREVARTPRPARLLLLWPDGRRETFELTDASTEEYQRRLTEADRRGDRDLVFPEGIDIDTSDADAASYWVDIVFASFLRKAQDLEVGGFDVDHLLLYDLTGVGLLMPLQEGVRPLRKRIQQWHAQSRPAHRFARISVLRDTALFLDITGVGRLLQQESPRFQLYVIEARDEEDLARRLREIDRYCREHSIRHLKLFGSVLRDREDGLEEVADPDRFFRPDSDLDLLVEFEPGTEVSLFDMVGMERELGELIGFKVDLRTAGDLSQYFRQQVIDQAKEAMPSEADRIRLQHMLDAARSAVHATTGRSREDLEEDDLLRDALVRRIEIIGEAATNVSPEACAELPEIPWPKVTGIRHRVIHHYFAVDLNVIWSTIQRDLPELIRSLESALASSSER